MTTRAQLKRELKKLGWSPAETARQLRVSRSTVTRWLRGERKIPGYMILFLRHWVPAVDALPASVKQRLSK